MDSKSIDLVRQSAEIVAQNAIPATNAFYTNLFAAAPAVRPLFPDEMFGQSEKLWASIVIVVQSLENLESLRPALRDLGARHVGYGAEPAHYELVVTTLVETLASLLGPRWTPDHGRAWNAVLTQVSDMMLEGAQDVAA